MKRAAVVLLLALLGTVSADEHWGQRYARELLEDLDGVFVPECGVLPSITSCVEFSAANITEARMRVQELLLGYGLRSSGHWLRHEGTYRWIVDFTNDAGELDLLWVFLQPRASGTYDVGIRYEPH